MDNQSPINNNPDNNINNVEVINTTPQSEVNNTPVNTNPDLADKTINAVENFINTEDHKDKFDEMDIRTNKTNSLLCYIPLVVFYYIFSGKYKNSNYLHFHVNQGLNMTIIWIASVVISRVLHIIFTKDSYIVNDTPIWVSLITFILYCISIVGSLFGIINTATGSSKEIPLIGKIKLLK